MASPSRASFLWPSSRLTGLFVAACITLVGCVRDVRPDVLLVRSAFAGIVAGVTALTVGAMVRRYLVEG